jgi:hypothetical protein
VRSSAGAFTINLATREAELVVDRSPPRQIEVDRAVDVIAARSEVARLEAREVDGLGRSCRPRARRTIVG